MHLTEAGQNLIQLRDKNMKQITSALVMVAFGCGNMASNETQASIIQSMTIEEIGVASGGLGTSAASLRAGEFLAAGTPADSGFNSIGSRDGRIIMGQTQGMNAFTLGFTFFGTPAFRTRRTLRQLDQSQAET